VIAAIRGQDAGERGEGGGRHGDQHFPGRAARRHGVYPSKHGGPHPCQASRHGCSHGPWNPRSPLPPADVITIHHCFRLRPTPPVPCSTVLQVKQRCTILAAEEAAYLYLISLSAGGLLASTTVTQHMEGNRKCHGFFKGPPPSRSCPSVIVKRASKMLLWTCLSGNLFLGAQASF